MFVDTFAKLRCCGASSVCFNHFVCVKPLLTRSGFFIGDSDYICNISTE